MNKQNILNFLQNHKFCSVATIAPDGFPDVAFVCYVIRSNFDIYFITETGTEKYKNLQRQKDVTMVVADSKSFEIAKIKGTAVLLQDSPKVMKTLIEIGIFFKGDVRLIPMLQRHEGSLALVKIKPLQIRMSKYREKEVEEKVVHFQ